MDNKASHNLIAIILCIAVSLLGRAAAAGLDLPVWLDTAGICLAACYAGPVGAVVTGVGSSLLFCIVKGISAVYVLQGLVTALAVSFAVRKGWLGTLAKAALAGFWLGVLCVAVATPLNLLVRGGYTGNYWGDALFDMLSWYGAPKALCALAGGAFVEIVDKQLCVLAAFGVTRMAGRAKAKKLSLLLAVCLLIGLCCPVHTAYAKEDSAAGHYVGSIFNNRTGMMASEANVIEETADGYIWIGSYAGLTRYDGRQFEFIREGGIVSVTCMLTDQKGRLWIGTNNDGVARYEDGKFVFFTTADGLPANSIRCFAEGEDGSVYVGTTDKVCVFDSNDKIEVLSSDMTYIVSMALYEGSLVCVSNGGKLFVLDGSGTLLAVSGEAEDLYYRCAAATSKALIVGTTEANAYFLSINEGKVEIARKIPLPLNDIVAIEEDRDGNLWMCGEKGFGYLDKNAAFVEKYYEGFDSSFAWLHEDYQGNIWVASTRYGVLKLSQSQFVDVFDEARIDDAVVNAFTYYQGDYYCGTDTGLIVLDADDYVTKSNALTELLAKDRIRCLLADSKGNLWACTYGDNGLVRYDGKGAPEIYNMQTKQTTTDRFRCAVELSDGTIAAGTADGINFIKDGKVTGRLTAEDGLANSQILSLAEGADGRLYAGSDGAGIYVIEEQKIVGHYAVDEGLPSGIILRIVPCEGGFLVVTGNSLVFMGEEIKVLKDFPYFNNYDIMIGGEQSYVLSSAGIYEVNTQGLCGDEPLKYRLYGANDGLAAGLTANSWNYMDENGRLFFCTNSGVMEFYGQQAMPDTAYQYGVISVVCDGEPVPQENGVLRVPAKAKNVVIEASVRSYALTGAKVKFYIEELENSPEIYDLDQIESIQLFGFPHGEYTVRMEILDSMGEKVLSEKTYVLKKEAQVWENVWFQIYLAMVCVEILGFIVWTALSILSSSRRKNELELQHGELEEKVAEQMREMESLFLQAVTAISDAVDAKDRYTSGHSKRVAVYAKMLAARMGKSEKEQEEIYFAGLLHDVGKIRIPETVINKPDSLSEEETELFKIHPVTGYHILKGISGNRSIADGARFHHECYDGSGYPSGLKGEDIPEIARIIGVADAYDAMASNRSYRRALPQDVVRDEIQRGRGTQFDPNIADIMLGIIDEDTGYTLKQPENQRKNILVVDDEPENILMTEHILEDGILCNILSATSGESALEMLEGYDIDLILLDIEMPGMDGFETFRRIREKSEVPIVFMTSNKNIHTILKAEGVGVEDYLTKPFLPQVLKEIVQSVLNW